MIIPRRYLITSALPYANGPAHIGHLAGCIIPSDIYARFRRLMGDETLFICGSDEHGAAITLRARKEGATPKEVVDKYHALFVETFDKLNISFDKYHRTSAPLHHRTAGQFFHDLYDKGSFIEKETEQYYDEEARQFLADRYITGTCPKCGYEGAYGDQCESCGSALSPTELIHPRSTLSGAKPVLKKTKHWFFPLDKHEKWLRAWIEEGTLEGTSHHYADEWKNHVVGQCKSWLDNGLQPRAMTRDLDWGVDVPRDIPGSEGKKLYVWMDAPIGYISSTKQWALDNNGDWEKWWKDEETQLVHFIGKDNIVFHCIIFPALLKEHGDFILPSNVPSNQFMNLEGNKISTSRNWAVWAHEYVEEMPDRIDELRFYLTKIMPEHKDSEFKWSGFQESVNTDLVNNLANFINRVIVLTNKYYKGVVPEVDDLDEIFSARGGDEISTHEGEMLDLFDRIDAVNGYLRKYEFRNALQELLDLSAAGNQLLQFNEPWKQIKERPEVVAPVIHLALQYVAALGLLTRPFMPDTSDRIMDLLNKPHLREDGELLRATNDLAEGLHLVKAGERVSAPKHLFTRIEDEVVERQMQKLHDTLEANKSTQYEPVKDTLSYDDFTKLDLRAGTILEAERVPKTDKLLKLTIDLGFEQRQVVSGIAADHDPSDIVGKKITLLANLAPRKIRGIESNGMILMAQDANGKLHFVSPEASCENGATIS